MDYSIVPHCNSLQGSTGKYRENPVIKTGTLQWEQGSPVMKAGFSLWELGSALISLDFNFPTLYFPYTLISLYFNFPTLISLDYDIPKYRWLSYK